jgi:hypothetical protein
MLASIGRLRSALDVVAITVFTIAATAQHGKPFSIIKG